MLDFELKTIIECTQIPSWITRVTPELIKTLFGQEYISKVSNVDLGGNKTNVQKEEMDYKVFQFYVYDGVVDDMTMMFSTQNMDSIGKVRVKDYDLFSQYTLNDIIKLLNNNGHKYHMIDALAYHEFICLPTLDTLSDISFDFNWIEGRWRLVSCYIPLSNLVKKYNLSEGL